MPNDSFDYSDLQHDAEFWRTLRRLSAATTDAIERPGADRLALCMEMLRRIATGYDRWLLRS